MHGYGLVTYDIVVWDSVYMPYVFTTWVPVNFEDDLVENNNQSVFLMHWIARSVERREKILTTVFI